MRSPAPVAASTGRPITIAALLLGPALLIAGCASVTSGTAEPDPAAGSGSVEQSLAPAPAGQLPGASDNFGAPHVTTPLNTAGFQPNPCVALTHTQLASIGIHVEGTVEQSDQGNICHWAIAPDTNYAFGFNLAFPAGEPLGLANAYQAAGPGELRRLPDVHGQPAVTQPSQNTDGSCTIYLGATDQIEYAVSVLIGPSQPQHADPCPIAQEIADDTTATMKSGG